MTAVQELLAAIETSYPSVPLLRAACREADVDFQTAKPLLMRRQFDELVEVFSAL